MAIGTPRWAKWNERRDYANSASGYPDIGNRSSMDLYDTIGVEHNDDGTHKTSGFLVYEPGYYTGNATDDRVLTLTNTSLDIVGILIVKEDGEYPVIKTTSMTGDNTKELATNAFIANAIQDITTTGQFTIGTDGTVNTNLATYYYVVWGTV